jgi:hypothetical protein|tara:strand:- start:57 stop:380 length:324 start_codon:yes stop_codon:yes gene_type:complete
MSHIFCYSCGVKIEYNFAKPNFCSKCGASFGGEQQSQAAVEQVPNQTKASVVSDDETDAEFVPQLRGLQVEIEKPKTFTIGSLAGQNTPPDYKGKGSYDLNDFTSKP